MCVRLLVEVTVRAGPTALAQPSRLASEQFAEGFSGSPGRWSLFSRPGATASRLFQVARPRVNEAQVLVEKEARAAFPANLERFLELFNSARNITGLQRCQGEVAERLSAIGQAASTAVLLESFLILAGLLGLHAAEGTKQVVEGFAMVRVQFHRPLPVLHGFLPPAQPRHHQAKLVVRIGVARRQSNDLA